jgi:hypothetical protein
MRQTNPPEIKALFILHIALLIGQILFTLIFLLAAYFRNFTPTSSWQSYYNQLIILCIAIGVAAYAGGNILFTKKLEQIKGDSKSLPEKFNDYRAACITRWALMEFAALFCLILFFTTNNFVLLIIGATVMLLFYTTRPSLQKTASDLDISEAEIEQMNTTRSK